MNDHDQAEEEWVKHIREDLTDPETPPVTFDREQAREELEQELRGRGMDDHDAHVAVDWITHLKTRDLVLRALGMRYVDLTRDNLNAALARATQAEQERDAARAHVICPVCGEIAHCDRAEVVALRTALEEALSDYDATWEDNEKHGYNHPAMNYLEVQLDKRWADEARAALGSTTEPEETRCRHRGDWHGVCGLCGMVLDLEPSDPREAEPEEAEK